MRTTSKEFKSSGFLGTVPYHTYRNVKFQDPNNCWLAVFAINYDVHVYEMTTMANGDAKLAADETEYGLFRLHKFCEITGSMLNNEQRGYYYDMTLVNLVNGSNTLLVTFAQQTKLTRAALDLTTKSTSFMFAKANLFYIFLHLITCVRLVTCHFSKLMCMKKNRFHLVSP